MSNDINHSELKVKVVNWYNIVLLSSSIFFLELYSYQCKYSYSHYIAEIYLEYVFICSFVPTTVFIYSYWSYYDCSVPTTLFTGLITCKYKLLKSRLGLISRQTHQSFLQYLSWLYLLYFDTSTYFILFCVFLMM